MVLSPVQQKFNHVSVLYEPLSKKIAACMSLKTFLCSYVCLLCELYFWRLWDKLKKHFLGLVVFWLESWTGLFREGRKGCSKQLKKAYSLKPGQQLVGEGTFSEALPVHWSRALLAGVGWTPADLLIQTYLLSWLSFSSPLWEEVFMEPGKKFRDGPQ